MTRDSLLASEESSKNTDTFIFGFLRSPSGSPCSLGQARLYPPSIVVPVAADLCP
jgi:hypothetical protein